jgi:8-oxo-dGTP pyrophosphatase MutT (NUDIX family)
MARASELNVRSLVREASRRHCRRPAQAEPLAIISSTVEIGRLRLALQRQDQRRILGQNRASVALILRPVLRDIELLVIRRATRDGDPWSGHMGLPGGRRDESDGEDYQTALRETREELGVDLVSSAEPIGTLDDIQAAANGQAFDLVIACFVFLVGASPSLVLNDEVTEALWVSLQNLRDGVHSMSHEVSFQGQPRLLPAFCVEGRVIWGITHRIVSNLLDRL